MNFVTLSILSALLFAITFFFRTLAVKTIPVSRALLIEVIAELILFAIAFFILSPGTGKTVDLKARGTTFALLAGVFVALGVGANILALKSGTLSKVVAITSPSQIIFGVFLGALLLGESVTFKSLLGIIFGIIGIVLMTL